MKILLIARLGSKRLPKKHLLNFNDSTKVIDVLIHELLKEFDKSEILLCTTNNEIDKELVEYLNLKFGIGSFCGDESNVLKRIYDCVNSYDSKYFIRLNGDNIFTQGKLIKAFSLIHETTNSEFTTNVEPRSLSKGLSFQAFNKNLFNKYYYRVKDIPYCKEHVFKDMSSHTSKFLNVSFDSDFLLKDDLALDTLSDFKRIKNMYLNNKSIYWNE